MMQQCVILHGCGSNTFYSIMVTNIWMEGWKDGWKDRWSDLVMVWQTTITELKPTWKEYLLSLTKSWNKDYITTVLYMHKHAKRTQLCFVNGGWNISHKVRWNHSGPDARPCCCYALWVVDEINELRRTGRQVDRHQSNSLNPQPQKSTWINEFLSTFS